MDFRLWVIALAGQILGQDGVFHPGAFHDLVAGGGAKTGQNDLVTLESRRVMGTQGGLEGLDLLDGDTADPVWRHPRLPVHHPGEMALQLALAQALVASQQIWAEIKHCGGGQRDHRRQDGFDRHHSPLAVTASVNPELTEEQEIADAAWR